jgi:hypothetical protein
MQALSVIPAVGDLTFTPQQRSLLVLIADFGKIGGGNRGYWEDQGYNWYGGI